MSYCRNPYYIYPTGNGVSFMGTFVEDVQLNVWLYNMLLKNRREELIKRIKLGKKECLKMEDPKFIENVTKNNIDTENMSDEEFDKIYYLNENDPELIAEKTFDEANEDEIIRNLLDQ